MYFSHSMSVLLSATLATAASVSSANPTLAKRSCGETAALVCFNATNSATPQNVDPDDVAYAATALRNIGEANAGTPGAFWTMPPATDCEEWQLPVEFAETVLALGKHINPRYNTSVLYTDIANAIDGGENPTPASLAASLLGACGADGGMVGVKANTSDPAYADPGYVAGKGRADGLLVKIVHAPV